MGRPRIYTDEEAGKRYRESVARSQRKVWAVWRYLKQNESEYLKNVLSLTQKEWDK